MSTPERDSLPDGPLVTWYGDDFTGAAAVMEVLTFAGLPAVLFLDKPDEKRLSRFAGYRGIGIAGAARSQGPDWMEENLPPIFAAMQRIGAPVSHYKICSTLDSSPTVGSIGKAIELALPVLGGAWHPLIVAAPRIGRYQAFGNLFASAGGTAVRLDRHPTMSRHPVTPMDEADVRLHLGRQTELPIGLIEITRFVDDTAQTALEAEQENGNALISLDVLDDQSLARAGRLIWENRGKCLFAVGSQGIEYALTAHWRTVGFLPKNPPIKAAGKTDRLAIVSGSCSPLTADQISWAAEHGFTQIRIDVARAVDEREWQNEVNRTTEKALSVLGSGGDPIVYTATGPADPANAAFASAIAATGQAPEPVNARVGSGLGKLMHRLLDEADIERAVIAGGDTSSHATAELGVFALTALAPIAHGAALCIAHRDDAETGFELALKGGQMGDPDFFGQVRNGGIH